MVFIFRYYTKWLDKHPPLTEKRAYYIEDIIRMDPGFVGPEMYTTVGAFFKKNNINYENKIAWGIGRGSAQGGALQLKLHGQSASGLYSTSTFHTLDRAETGENGMKKTALEHSVFPGEQNGFCKEKLFFFGEIHQM